MKDEYRLLVKVCLKRLGSAAVWAYALFYSVVIVSLPEEHCHYGLLMQGANYRSDHKLCLHSSLKQLSTVIVLGQVLWHT